jgi:hypothetical protein
VPLRSGRLAAACWAALDFNHTCPSPATHPSCSCLCVCVHVCVCVCPCVCRHLDADEAVVLGAGLFAANLSTTFRLRQFGLTDKVSGGCEQ